MVVTTSKTLHSSTALAAKKAAWSPPSAVVKDIESYISSRRVDCCDESLPVDERRREFLTGLDDDRSAPSVSEESAVLYLSVARSDCLTSFVSRAVRASSLNLCRMMLQARTDRLEGLRDAAPKNMSFNSLTAADSSM